VDVSTPEVRLLIGDAAFVVCCAFYLVWWIIRFHPSHPATGPRVGWVLIPAIVAGLTGVGSIMWGISSMSGDRWIPTWMIIVGWVLLLVVLAVGTRQLFDRPVTSELPLITGWGALALAQVSALTGEGLFARPTAWWFVILAIATVVGSLVCYVAYYRLRPWPSYIDGMIPLILTGGWMSALSVGMVVAAG